LRVVVMAPVPGGGHDDDAVEIGPTDRQDAWLPVENPQFSSAYVFNDTPA
jgi:hypothetical protein